MWENKGICGYVGVSGSGYIYIRMGDVYIEVNIRVKNVCDIELLSWQSVDFNTIIQLKVCGEFHYLHITDYLYKTFSYIEMRKYDIPQTLGSIRDFKICSEIEPAVHISRVTMDFNNFCVEGNDKIGFIQVINMLDERERMVFNCKQGNIKFLFSSFKNGNRKMAALKYLMLYVEQDFRL